jgi:hypothetical protein
MIWRSPLRAKSTVSFKWVDSKLIFPFWGEEIFSPIDWFQVSGFRFQVSAQRVVAEAPGLIEKEYKSWRGPRRDTGNVVAET